MSIRIHVFGASGTGTSALCAALATRTGATHLDTDSYFWEETNPPFQRKRENKRRIEMLDTDLDKFKSWVLTGSLCGWGDSVIPLFNLVIFLYLDSVTRMERIREREAQRFGKRIEPGGDMYRQHRSFMRWASGYDNARPPMRSLEYHALWMQQLTCPVPTLDSKYSLDRLCDEVLVHI